MENKTRGRSIAVRIFLTAGILVFVTFVIQTLISMRMSLKAVKAVAEQSVLNKADGISNTMQWRISATLNTLVGIGEAPILRNPKASSLERETFFKNIADKNFRETIDPYGKIRFFDVNGYSHHSDCTTEYGGDTAWFDFAKKGFESIIEGQVSTPEGKRSILIHGAPIYDNEHNFIGALAADMAFADMDKRIKKLEIGKNGYSYIIGGTGNLIAHKNIDIRTLTNISDVEKKDPGKAEEVTFIRNALKAGGSGTGYYKISGIDYIAAYSKFEYDDFMTFVAIPKTEFFNEITKLRNTLIIVAAVCLAIAMGVLRAIAHYLAKPISQVASALQNVSVGDFSKRIAVRGKSEISQMAIEFNQAVENVGHIIRLVEDNAATVKNVGIELSNNTNETTKSINTIHSNLQVMNEQIKTQSASVQDTATAIEDIRKSIKNLNGHIEMQAVNVSESSSTIEELVANIASATEILKQNAEQVNNLQEKSSEVKETVIKSVEVSKSISGESESLLEAVNVIQNIASQTNLLAMNAAIEAAHAGDSGKGFAVVADEIRKLAEESSTQGKQINSVLKGLKTRIDGIANDIVRVETLFMETYELTEEVKNREDTVMNAMHEQTAGSQEVLKAISDINTITGEVKSGSSAMLTANEKVSSELDKLMEITATINGSMKGVSGSIGEIERSVLQINELTQQNNRSIENLEGEVNKFTV